MKEGWRCVSARLRWSGIKRARDGEERKQRETWRWDDFDVSNEEKERQGEGETREMKLRDEARERKKEGEEGEEGKGKKGRKRREGGRKKFFSRQKNAKIL